MKRNQLTVQFVRSVKEPGRYTDGYGLMLVAKPTGGKSWIQRLVIRGKRRDIGLGPLDRVSLAQARKVAFDNRNIAREGGDPTVTEEARPVPSFADGVEAVIAIQRGAWKSEAKSEAQWRASLRDYAIPRLGRMPVDAITTADVLAVLVPIWHTKRETARRVRQRIGKVMQWAMAEGHRTDDPAGPALGAALPKTGAKREHHRALPYHRVAGALAKVRTCNAYIITILAVQFLVLTAARSGEVRGARWGEIDFDAMTWTIPGSRMKTGREHRIPLSAAALGLLRDAREYTDGGPLVFPSLTGRTISDSTMSKLFKEHKIGAVPHGFRSSFRQWAAERTNIPREVCEFALAHVVGDAAERAYQRSDLFDRRRDLMDAWSRYLAGASGNVIALMG